MDEISQGPERERELSPKTRRLLGVLAMAGLVAVAATLTLTRGGGGHPGAAAPRASAATAASAAPVSQAGGLPPPLVPAVQETQFVGPPGAQIIFSSSSQITSTRNTQQVTQADLPKVRSVAALSCQPVSQGQLGPGWRAGSLHAGPLWLVGGRKLGYAHLGVGTPRPGGLAHGAPVRKVQVLVYVDAGSFAIMAIATGASPYSQFTDGAGRPLGVDAVVFPPCPDSGGRAEAYRLGFSIAAGHPMAVEVWTVPSARPVYLTLTAPKKPA